MTDTIPGKVKLDESQPEEWYLPPGTREVTFHNAARRTVDRAALEGAILEQTQRLRVRNVTVGWTSQMDSMWVALCFPNLEGVVCASPLLRDLRELVGLDSLRSLSIRCEERPARSLDVLPYLKLDRLVVDIWRKSDVDAIARYAGPLQSLHLGRWREVDFGSLGSLRVRDVEIIGGSARSSNGLNCDMLRKAWFGRCTKLERLENIAVPHLWLDMCESVDLNSIGTVSGLRALRLVTRRKRESLDFLRRCATLETAEINGPIPADVRGLIEAPSLRSAWLGVPSARLLEVSRGNANLILGNGEVSARGGKYLPQQAYYEAARQYFSSSKSDQAEFS